MSHNQLVESLYARAESAEARVKELEAAADRNANVIYADESVERYRKRITDLESDLDFANDCLEASRRNGQTLSERITDLESQLDAAREEQGLEAKVREVLGERFGLLNLFRLFSGHWRAQWGSGRRAHAATLPALLRAILEVEAKG